MKKLVKLTSDFTNAKIGDLVTDIEGVTSIISNIDKDGFRVYKIYADNIGWFTCDGKWMKGNKTSTVFNGHHENLVICTEVEEEETAPSEQKESDLEILLREYIEAKKVLEKIQQKIKDLIL